MCEFTRAEALPLKLGGTLPWWHWAGLSPKTVSGRSPTSVETLFLGHVPTAILE